MLKLKNKITYTLLPLIVLLAWLLSSAFAHKLHPIYVGVIDMNYDAPKRTMQLSIKLFASDIEDALRKQTKQPIDVIHPKNKAALDTLLIRYIKKRLQLTVNNLPTTLMYVGTEYETDGSLYTYIELQNITSPKTIAVNTTLLYDYLPKQLLLIHTQVNAIKKSTKLVNPSNKAMFEF